MANRVKEDEKNERIIRNLLKLPENRRCINCNSLGPQYVCTSFSTFVCTTCGGIHREFTHRVKSVSMAKFTPQEVSALQGGGNVRGREFFLKEWDPERNSLPDGSNVERLRDFIKHVYVDRRYTGERNVEKPPRTKMPESEAFSGNRRMDSYQGGSRSPPYDDSFERRHSDRSSPGGRSPGYDENIQQNSNYRRSPAHAEVVNDWRKEDRFGNGMKSAGRSSNGGPKLDGGSPDSQRDLDMSSPPVVRPVRDILGENVSPLRVIEPPKTTSGKSTNSSQTLRTVSSSSMPSPVVNPTEVQVEASFIDFDSVPEPATTASVDKQMSMDVSSSTQMTAPSGGNDWANFDSVTQIKAYNATSTSVESVLSELSITASTAGPAAPVGSLPSFQPSGSQGLSLVSSFGSNALPLVLPPGGAHLASFGPQANQLAKTDGGLLATTTTPTAGQWPTLNQEHFLFSDNNLQPLSQQVRAPVSAASLTNKVWNPITPNAPRQPIEQANASSVANMGQAASFGYPTPTVSLSEANSGGRKALPEDLFTRNYPYTPSPVPGWYSGSPYVAGFPMHYNMPMAIPNFQPVSRSTNPFDVGNEPSPVQASTFPSVASLQDALPKTATPSGFLHTPGFGAPFPHSAHPQMPAHASAVAQTGAFFGQEITRGMAPRPQGHPRFSHDQPGFSPLNSNPQLSGPHPGHSTTSNFTPASGNPFG